MRTNAEQGTRVPAGLGLATNRRIKRLFDDVGEPAGCEPILAVQNGTVDVGLIGSPRTTVTTTTATDASFVEPTFLWLRHLKRLLTR
jgi:hypothetical protein